MPLHRIVVPRAVIAIGIMNEIEMLATLIAVEKQRAVRLAVRLPGRAITARQHAAARLTSM
jgi:hypothetical protein